MLTKTQYNFPGQIDCYHGKVRDAYFLRDDIIVMVATDRISAFDVILPRGIKYKGQVLNQLAAYFLDAVADIIPNWKITQPDPVVTIGHRCTPLKVEVIVRGYLAGSAARAYNNGVRTICGVTLPDGLKENQKLSHPIITPTTKADTGHDLDISRDEIIAQSIVDKDIYEQVEDAALKLFKRGSEMAEKQGLILVDTKYEFGLKQDKLYLIDEIHTPDSSRYFYADEYQQRLDKNEPQRQLSKEFVRRWLINHNFMGRPGDKMPEMTDNFIDTVSQRYIELYQQVTGQKFHPAPDADNDTIARRVEQNVLEAIKKI